MLPEEVYSNSLGAAFPPEHGAVVEARTRMLPAEKLPQGRRPTARQRARNDVIEARDGAAKICRGRSVLRAGLEIDDTDFTFNLNRALWDRGYSMLDTLIPVLSLCL